MVGVRDQNVFLIYKDTSNFVEFEISEFEMLRFDCNLIQDFDDNSTFPS